MSKKITKEPSCSRVGAKDYNYIRVNIKTHHDNNGGHPHVILENVDDKHVSVGFSTKRKKGKKGGTNFTMEKSPFDDGKQSYMRRQGLVAPKNEYSGKREGTLTPKDYDRARQYGERAKQKYLDGKKHKKSNDVPTLMR